jgi:hypothetical protein
MRLAVVTLLLLSACSGGSATPDGACKPSDPACDPGSTSDSGVVGDAHAAEHDAASEATTPATDASAGVLDAGCMLWVDDAGVTQGCGQGDMGPGDRDDGGGGPPPPPPDAALDASELGFGASCWDNAQCASDLCFDFKVRGTFCSQICSTNAQCPSTSPGCNGMGVCRVTAGE